MHNLSNEYFQNELETGDNEYGNELSPEFEFSNEYAGESASELLPEFEFEFEDREMEFEMYETQMVQELQELSNEAEFGGWLKRLGKKAAGAASGFLSSPTGQQAISALGNIARKTLPGLGAKAGGWAGGKLGGMVGHAGAGRKLGQQYGSRAGQAAADRYPDFVRFATDTLSNLSREFETGVTPDVRPAIVKAAKKYYPIILKVRGTLYGRQQRSMPTREFEYTNEYNNEYNGETYGETNDEMEGEITSNEGSFNEVTEMELASELLAVQSELELDQFLGKLFKKAVGGIKKFAQSSTGRALGGMLKGLAKKALPIAGKALGTFIAPGIGTAVGGALGTAASNLFELELEGLSAEDREFETARAFVRFAGNSARRASVVRGGNAGSAARTAIINSARRYAPGLIARRRPRVYNSYNRGYTVNDHTNNYTVNDHRNDDDDQNGSDIELAQEGTWYRQGGNIVLKA